MAAATPSPSRQTVSKKQPLKDTRETLNMRIKPEVRLLIDQAAACTGKNRTDFVLDAARQTAHNILVDRALVPLNEEAYTAFLALLDAQLRPNDRLRKSLQTAAVWD